MGCPVVQVGHPVAETTLALQTEREADAGGKALVPPPTMIGATKKWHSSTRACSHCVNNE
jgi:hypothetical protein